MYKEEETLQCFKNTVQQDQKRWYVLRLPIKPDIQILECSLAMEISRFINIKRRVQRDDHLRKEYTNFINKYIKMNHMHKVNAKYNILQYICCLPHNPVIKLSSLTTKTRVLFDASARTSSITEYSMAC